MARSSTQQHKKKSKPTGLSKSARPARPLFRLIPLTMVMATGLLTLKSIEIYQTGRSLHEELLISTVNAQDNAASSATQPTAATGKPAPTEENTAATNQAAASRDAPVSSPPATNRPQDAFSTSSGYSKREMDVLDSLSERRKRLDDLEHELTLRERVLRATEARIDGKIKELNAMSAELKELLVAYDKEENAKISSLVKIYEAMKPKDAARIFDELDMDILLLVVDRMSERRVAPVLAEMNPAKARDLTQQLADEQRRQKPSAFNSPLSGEDENYSPPLF